MAALFTLRCRRDMSTMTYAPASEPGGGTAELRRGGDAPPLTDAAIAFCGGMMENISIRWSVSCFSTASLSLDQ